VGGLLLGFRVNTDSCGSFTHQTRWLWIEVFVCLCVCVCVCVCVRVCVCLCACVPHNQPHLLYWWWYWAVCWCGDTLNKNSLVRQVLLMVLIMVLIMVLLMILLMVLIMVLLMVLIMVLLMVLIMVLPGFFLGQNGSSVLPNYFFARCAHTVYSYRSGEWSAAVRSVHSRTSQLRIDQTRRHAYQLQCFPYYYN